MEKVLMKLQDLLIDELEKITAKNDISPSELDNAKKAMCVIKDIETTIAMKDSGYSEMMPYSMNRGSYARGRDASTGRYISRRGSMSMGEDGYSSHSIKDRMIAQLESMYDEAKGDHEKQLIDQWINRLEMEK